MQSTGQAPRAQMQADGQEWAWGANKETSSVSTTFFLSVRKNQSLRSEGEDGKEIHEKILG